MSSNDQIKQYRVQRFNRYGDSEVKYFECSFTELVKWLQNECLCGNARTLKGLQRSMEEATVECISDVKFEKPKMS